VKEATDRAQAAKVGDKVKIVLGDLEADISQATVVTLYLLDVEREAHPKAQQRLKPGTESCRNPLAWASRIPAEVHGRQRHQRT
jgi:hypothetical protein